MLDSMRDSVERGGADIGENPKLKFLLGRAKAMGCSESEIDLAVAGKASSKAAAAPPAADATQSISQPVVSSAESMDAAGPAAVQLPPPVLRPAADVMFDGIRPPSSAEELAKMDSMQMQTRLRLRSAHKTLTEFNDYSEEQVRAVYNIPLRCSHLYS